MVKLLLEEGANINAKAADGTTPLHYAVTECQAEMVKFLLEKGANIKLKDQDGDTPLHFAAYFGFYENANAIRSFFKGKNSYKDIATIQNNDGSTALHLLYSSTEHDLDKKSLIKIAEYFDVDKAAEKIMNYYWLTPNDILKIRFE